MKIGTNLTIVLVSIATFVSGPRTSAQAPGSPVNVTTRQQDIPAICTGCVYRTGANLAENKLVYGTISPNTFGQFCNPARSCS